MTAGLGWVWVNNHPAHLLLEGRVRIIDNSVQINPSVRVKLEEDVVLSVDRIVRTIVVSCVANPETSTNACLCGRMIRAGVKRNNFALV